MSTGQGPNESTHTDFRRCGAEFTPGEAWRELGEYLGKVKSDGRLLRPGDLVATVRRRAESDEPGWADLLRQLHTEVVNVTPSSPAPPNLTPWECDPEAEVNAQTQRARQNSERYTEFLNPQQATRPVIRAPAQPPHDAAGQLDGPTRRLGADRGADARGNSAHAPAGSPARPGVPATAPLPPAPGANGYPPPARAPVVTGADGFASGDFGPSGAGGFGPHGGNAASDSGEMPENGQPADEHGNGGGVRGAPTPPSSGRLGAEHTGAEGGTRVAQPGDNESAGPHRVSFLQSGEPDEIFGTGERTAPPVIGE